VNLPTIQASLTQSDYTQPAAATVDFDYDLLGNRQTVTDQLNNAMVLLLLDHKILLWYCNCMN
jgi:YD repeat-containing protein